MVLSKIYERKRCNGQRGVRKKKEKKQDQIIINDLILHDNYPVDFKGKEIIRATRKNI